MADLATTQSYYFSSNHLAADLFYNVAGFTLFCALGGALYPDLSAIYLAMLDTVADYQSTVLAAFAVGVYALLGSVCGLLSNRLVLALRDLIPGLQDAVGYRRLYKTKLAKVAQQYTNCFGESRLYAEESLEGTEMRNRLMFLLGRINQMGYSHIYRAYSIVALFRQAIVYTVALAALRWWFVSRIPILPVTLVLLFLGWAGLRFAIAYAASSEYDFIVVTSHLMKSGVPETPTATEGLRECRRARPLPSATGTWPRCARHSRRREARVLVRTR